MEKKCTATIQKKTTSKTTINEDVSYNISYAIRNDSRFVWNDFYIYLRRF